MTKVVSIYEAKTQLSKLVKKAQAGETIYIGAYGRPQAVIAPVPTKPNIKLGVWQGKYKITYSDADLIDSDPELTEQMTSGALFPEDGND
jgi:antitoxin (DNA-binding transcriptional repressor) of toxin-antitoxin stability system